MSTTLQVLSAPTIKRQTPQSAFNIYLLAQGATQAEIKRINSTISELV